MAAAAAAAREEARAELEKTTTLVASAHAAALGAGVARCEAEVSAARAEVVQLAEAAERRRMDGLLEAHAAVTDRLQVRAASCLLVIPRAMHRLWHSAETWRE